MGTWEEWEQHIGARPAAPPVAPVTGDLATRIAAEVPAEVDNRFKDRAQRAYDRSRKYDDKFSKYRGKYGLPENLLIAVAMAESSGVANPETSEAGARGLMQFMPGTATDYGLVVTDPASNDPALDERLDPRKAIKAAAQKLSRDLKRADGNIDAALMQYNWGPGAYQSWVRNPNKRMPKETRIYITRVRYAMFLAAQARKKQAQQ